MKKMFMFFWAVTLLATGLYIPFPAAAANASEPAYAQSMQRLMDLGIFSRTEPERMELEKALTREQLATVVILLNGHEDKISLSRNANLFPDVAPSRWSAGYIGAAVKLGYMRARADGRFHPEADVTFAEISEIFGKLLRYKDYNLAGSYPDNYVNLMANLGILDGISYSANKAVTRGQAAVMVDRLLSAKVFGDSREFIDTVSVYRRMIILENNFVNKNADERKIVTDIGVFYLEPSLAIPQAGRQYIARFRDGQITQLAQAGLNYRELSVKYVASGKILTHDGKTEYLPSNVTWYYQAAPSSLDMVMANIRTNSSLVIGTRKDGTGYGVLFDPVYSQPRVITPGMTPGMLENLYGGKTIDRDGKYISPAQIEAEDVVYEVTDIWGDHAYVVIHANSVSGEITAILPSKISPRFIEVDGVSYPLSDDFPIEKITGQGGLQVDQRAKVLLDGNGQAVDIILEGDSDNRDFVLVLNAYDKPSTEIEDYGRKRHYVTLLHADGSKKTYLTEQSEIEQKGRIARYAIIKTGKKQDDYDTVKLTRLEYESYGTVRIDKDNRMLDNSTVTNDVVIFNMIDNIYGTDSVASVLKWSDLPGGYIQSGKVLYMRKTGDFQDIDVLYLDNILDQGVAYGLVTQISSTYNPMAGTAIHTATIMIGGKNYIYSYAEGNYHVGQVLRVKFNGQEITGVDKSITAAVVSTMVDAVDSSRIRIRGVTYSFRSDITILKYDGETWKTTGTSDIVKGDNHRYISVYLDKPINFGGKVVLITMR
ncbi:MAG TPA: S-layer homology domain-containing protein [Thermoclostridium caenicola]|nr:S-layer homology domain-containing protein [Thermoclostridium caenicola]